MYACDFEYDGQRLSDYDFIICEFEAVNGIVLTETGSNISFEKVAKRNGDEFSIVSANYTDCIKTTFDICKNPDSTSYTDGFITTSEFREIMRWLNRKEFLKLRIIDEENDVEPYFFNASFNVQKIKINDKLFGIRLNMETDKPFAYGETISQKFTISSLSNPVRTMENVSDEIGYIYPYIKIKCNAAGTLSITNDMASCEDEDAYTMTINNCSVGEEIVIDGNSQIITTSILSHNICNDFNYKFFRIGNTFSERINAITFSNLCEMTIQYNPIIKNTI